MHWPKGVGFRSPTPISLRNTPGSCKFDDRSIGLVEWLILCKFVLNHIQNISTNKNMSAHTILLYFKYKFCNRLCNLSSIPLYKGREWNLNWLVHFNCLLFHYQWSLRATFWLFVPWVCDIRCQWSWGGIWGLFGFELYLKSLCPECYCLPTIP